VLLLLLPFLLLLLGAVAATFGHGWVLLAA
jgi:hypothetical protein